MRKFVLGFSLVCISTFSNQCLSMCSCFFSSSCVCRVQNESPFCVLNADMFATPSTTFEFPSYTAKLAHLLAEAPSPPLRRTSPFNKLVLDFLDMEAEQGGDSDRYGN